METTHWGRIVSARDGEDEEAREAMEALCTSYWLPAYTFIRARGAGQEEAEDLTQEFFAIFIEKKFIQQVRRERGRFRGFFLTSLKNFLANEWRKSNAQKRGGGTPIISLDVPYAENELEEAKSACNSPEDIYQRAWARSLLKRAHTRLKNEYRSPDQRRRFALLEEHIVGDADLLPYKKLATEMGIAAATLRVTVHRLRHRYGEIIRDEIAQTLTRPEDARAELQELLSALT